MRRYIALGAVVALFPLISIVEAAVNENPELLIVAATPAPAPKRGTYAGRVAPTTRDVPVTTTSGASAGPQVLSLTDPNWSGYVLTGGPFTGVSGTFTVPSLYNDGSCGDGLSSWVGIDGNSGVGLLQAGVQESYNNPSTGGCDPSASYWIEPWWEVLPAPETIVRSVQVHPGDSVTVSIAKTSTPGLWSVSLRDNTDGLDFLQMTRYSGPATSAEWVDEAPSVPSGTECGSGVAPGGNGTVVCPVAPYSDVAWSDLRLAQPGKVIEVLAKTIVQGSSDVSAPSTVLDLSDLLSSGFSDRYEGSADG
jgi:hypothetical protein